MTGLLSKAGSKLTVKQLLDTLAETMEFEASMVKKYSTPVGAILRVLGFKSELHYITPFVAAGNPKSDYSCERDAPGKTHYVCI